VLRARAELEVLQAGVVGGGGNVTAATERVREIEARLRPLQRRLDELTRLAGPGSSSSELYRAGPNTFPELYGRGGLQELALTDPDYLRDRFAEKAKQTARELQQLEALRVTAAQDLDRIEKSLARTGEHQLAIAEKRRALSQAEIALAQQKLAALDSELAKSRAILDQLEQKAQTGKEQFGMMSSLEQVQSIEAARQLRARGIGSLTEIQLGVLGKTGIGQEMLREFAVKQQDQLGHFRRFSEVSGFEDKLTAARVGLGALEESRMSLRGEIDMKVSVDEEAITRAFEAADKKILKDILDVTLRRLDAELKKTKDDLNIKAVHEKQ